MNSKHIGGDINYAGLRRKSPSWAQGAAEVIYRQEIAAAPDPEALLGQKTEYYRKTSRIPFWPPSGATSTT